ncbi:MAG: M48 family metallopeptidase [Desulfuromonadales bacterium]|nr:M48 family metallopeptidase [Desulfuromonadales bacterium]
MAPYILLTIFVLITAFTYWLRYINLAWLKKYGSVVPVGFEDALNPEILEKTSAYTFESSRVSLYSSLFDNFLTIIFLFTGLFPLYDRFIAGLTNSFIISGILFFIIIVMVQTLLELPFSLYSTFVVEAKYGFNTMTFRLWVVDFLKSQVINYILLGLIISVVFWLITWSPSKWWVLVWAFMALFGLFMMFISPYIIEPLFNKFEPVTEEGLSDKIRAMMEKAGLKLGKVVQMDASKRSKHSNAYFTGIGKVKRIVLYDTLIKQMTHEEIVAVLAHEIGHWKKKHILKRIIMVEIFMFLGAWIVFQAVQWNGLPALLGMVTASFPARLLIIGFVASLVMFPITPLSAWLSRRDEKEADQFAVDIVGSPDSLASALIKLSSENLSNLHPHPFYAKFYYSHPPVVQRVNRLKSMSPE